MLIAEFVFSLFITLFLDYQGVLVDRNVSFFLLLEKNYIGIIQLFFDIFLLVIALMIFLRCFSVKRKEQIIISLVGLLIIIVLVVSDLFFIIEKTRNLYFIMTGICVVGGFVSYSLMYNFGRMAS